MPTGIVYATASKLPRRVVVCDTIGELANPSHVQTGETMLVVSGPLGTGAEALRVQIAAATGVSATAIPTGRCAVVDPATQLAEAFVVADPALDTVLDKTVAATDEAQLNWKLDPKAGWLARFVGAGPDGVVTDVQWAAPDSPPGQAPQLSKTQGATKATAQAAPVATTYVQDGFAQVGDTVAALTMTTVPTTGAVAI